MVAHPDEADGPRVVRRGSRERLGDGGLDHLGSHGVGTEPAYRTPEQLSLGAALRHGLLGAQPEQVVLAGAQQIMRR